MTRHGHAYLMLPFGATLFNLALAVFLFRSPKASATLVPVQSEENGPSACIDHANDGSCTSTSARFYNITIYDEPDYASQDPHLVDMPRRDFRAYVRPDVSTFYRKELGAMQPTKPKFTGQAGKFVNLTPDRLGLYWDSGRDRGAFMGAVLGYQATGTATFPGHRFFFGETDDPNEALCSFVVRRGTSVYYCDPYSEEIVGPASGFSKEARNLRELDPVSTGLYEKHIENVKFAKEYKKLTGIEWLAMYPRDPPRHKIHSADYFGQEHHVVTTETHFIETPPLSKLKRIVPKAREEGRTVPLREHRSANETLEVTLRAVSCAPRVFEISNFISHAEADHILELGTTKHNLRRSTTGDGGGKPSDRDSTRTSLNTWVQREESPIIDAIYRRVADVVQIDEALLRTRGKEERPQLGTKSSIAEQLQMVHYDPGQEYTAHHDFGYNKMSDLHQPSRSINMLLYLNDVEEGGETSFPRWLNAETRDALNVKPEKGKAVLFYMLLPDGNPDDRTQHAALPVIKGEKWIANLWIWDPFMS